MPNNYCCYLKKLPGAALHGKTKIISSIHIDSRICTGNQQALFVAIKGNRHDGHAYIEELYKSGVRHFIVNRNYKIPAYMHGAFFAKTENTITALQNMAQQHRILFKGCVLAVTGSNGKTIVKEWAHYIAKGASKIYKSPKSYNSQIGVPLSVLAIPLDAEAAVLEAGISLPGEMQVLEKIIRPDIFLFTNLGHSHQLNFSSYKQKLYEKLELAANSKTIIYKKGNPETDTAIESLINKEIISWCWEPGLMPAITAKKKKEGGRWQIQLSGKTEAKFQIPFSDEFSADNAVSAYIAAWAATGRGAQIQNGAINLPQVEMRMSIAEGAAGSTIINDCYSSDIESIERALLFLGQQVCKGAKIAVISDFDHPAENKTTSLGNIANLCQKAGVEQLYLVGGINLPGCSIYTEHFATTEIFIKRLESLNFSGCCVLLKGSRAYSFERLAKILEKRSHSTVLEVRLDAIASNLSYFRNKLRPETKIMAMVKAFSYGAGDYEIASLLEQHNTDYLAVAFVDEGIALRNKGIKLPIVVMNPEVENYALMIRHSLEPEIYSLQSLRRLIHESEGIVPSQGLSLHIKLDTGMNRLGMSGAELAELAELIGSSNGLKVASIFSHLSAADDPRYDSFTEEQVSLFEQWSSMLESLIGYKTMKHILNSAGTERFACHQFDMVRLGIGLYGISSLPGVELDCVSSLKTIVSQIKTASAGQTVGYSRSWKLNKDSRIGVLPIGYADGLSRRFSNGKGKVTVAGKIAPIIGNICMDACMIDLTGIDAQVGDQAVIFGSTPTISELAQIAGTIPYEILTSVSKRVKRVYSSE
jgi:Alr-MurF fusion protein